MKSVKGHDEQIPVVLYRYPEGCTVKEYCVNDKGERLIFPDAWNARLNMVLCGIVDLNAAGVFIETASSDEFGEAG